MARSTGSGGRARAEITVAELLGRQPESSVRPRRRYPASTAPSRPRRVARGARQRRRRVLLGGVAVLIVAGLSVLSILAHQPANPGITGDASGVAARARQWLDAYASGLVLADRELGAQLVHAGWDPGRVTTSCAPAVCPANWLVSTPALRADLTPGGLLDSAVRHSTPVAVFGWGADRVEVRHSGVDTAEQAASELRARTAVGQALARVPRVAADPGVQALLDTGRADPRVLAMLAALAQRGTVRVLEMPAVPGEDAAGQPRREMLLAVPPDGAGVLTRFFAAQRGPYRPLATTSTPAGLLVRYPPVAPPHLLDGFDGP